MWRSMILSIAIGLAGGAVLSPQVLASRQGRIRLAKAAYEGDPAAGKDVFDQNCVLCHGSDGRGDGPAAAALNPKPANFHDHDRMSKLPESTRFKAVSEGGASVGVSPVMPSFKDTLSQEQIRDVLAYIRTAFK